LTFNGLHGIISQKRELFITADVRTPNPIQNVPSNNAKLHTMDSMIKNMRKEFL
jgi:hypothetical protein